MASRVVAPLRLFDLPPVLRSPYGDIAVVIVPGPYQDKDGKELLGRYECQDRRITVSAAHADRAAAWQTLYHEWVHSALVDSGLHCLMADGLEEAVCDCLGAAQHWFIENNFTIAAPGRKTDRSRA